MLFRKSLCSIVSCFAIGTTFSSHAAELDETGTQQELEMAVQEVRDDIKYYGTLDFHVYSQDGSGVSIYEESITARDALKKYDYLEMLKYFLKDVDLDAVLTLDITLPYTNESNESNPKIPKGYVQCTWEFQCNGSTSNSKEGSLGAKGYGVDGSGKGSTSNSKTNGYSIKWTTPTPSFKVCSDMYWKTFNACNGDKKE